MVSAETKWVHIALAVVRDNSGRVLLALRPEDKHQGGLWEFPGGKVEPGEGVREALARELNEEVGIVPTSSQPLIQIRHHYPEVSVLLDCWEVAEFSGHARGCEGQPICWEVPAQLDSYSFPAANRALIKAVQLPKRYWITPDDSVQVIEQAFVDRLAAGVRLVRLRAPSLPLADRVAQASTMAERLKSCAGLLVVGLDEWQAGAAAYASGIQLNRHQLAEYACDDQGLEQVALFRRQGCCWLGASCHSQQELALAQRLGCDFATLSPCRPTKSHPGADVLGDQQVKTLLKQTLLPVYLLGGMTDSQLEDARALGGQGVAGIRSVGLQMIGAGGG